MKLNKYLYNTIVVLLPLMIYFILSVIITKDLNAISIWFKAIIFAKTYIFWGIIFASYFGIYLLYKKIKYFIFLLPIIVIAIATFDYYGLDAMNLIYIGADSIMFFCFISLPIILASIVYPIGIGLYNKLYKPADDLTL